MVTKCACGRFYAHEVFGGTCSECNGAFAEHKRKRAEVRAKRAAAWERRFSAVTLMRGRDQKILDHLLFLASTYVSPQCKRAAAMAAVIGRWHSLCGAQCE